MSIRRLRSGDAPAYRDLMLEAYDRHPDAFTSSTDERAALPVAWWEARLQESSAAREMVWGAFSGGRLAGVAGLSLESREKVRHKATLFGMYVRADYRRHGLGARLVRAVLLHARSAGLKVVQLTVTEGNLPARTLYERHGFIAFGIEPFAVRVADAFVAKVHMWRDLGEEPSIPEERERGTWQRAELGGSP